MGHPRAFAHLPPALPEKEEAARSPDTESWRPGVSICQNGELGQRTHLGGQSPSSLPGAGLPSSTPRGAVLQWRLLLRAPPPSFWGWALSHEPEARPAEQRREIIPVEGQEGVSGERLASRGQGAGRPRGDFRRVADRLSLPKRSRVSRPSLSGVTLTLHFCSF